MNHTQQSPASATPQNGFRTFAFAGGLAGLLGFLATGLMPALVYGGFAGVTLAAALLGAPVDANLLGRAIVVFGMLVGLLGTASVYVVVGAALGAGVFQVARMLRLDREAPQAEKSNANHS